MILSVLRIRITLMRIQIRILSFPLWCESGSCFSLWSGSGSYLSLWCWSGSCVPKCSGSATLVVVNPIKSLTYSCLVTVSFYWLLCRVTWCDWLLLCGVISWALFRARPASCLRCLAAGRAGNGRWDPRSLAAVLCILKPNSWTYNFIEASGQNLERCQTLGFHIKILQFYKLLQTTFDQGEGGVKSVSSGDCE
jgi:hypothetical protein